ncbi:MAG: stage II sporulation protein P [Roseburia intestinalis]
MYAYRYRHLKKKKINGAVWLGGLLLAVIGILLQTNRSFFAKLGEEGAKSCCEKVLDFYLPGLSYSVKDETEWSFVEKVIDVLFSGENYEPESGSYQTQIESDLSYEAILAREAADENYVDEKTGEVIPSVGSADGTSLSDEKDAGGQTADAGAAENTGGQPAEPGVAENTGEQPAEADAAENQQAQIAEAGSADSQAASAVADIKAVTFAREKLNDFDYLIQNFYQVDNTTTIGSTQLNADALLGKDVRLSHDASTPQILIYHTHSQEGYADSVPGDASMSVVGVGDYLTELLTQKYGFSVIHHTGQYDVGDRDHAYAKAGPALEQILAENKSIEVVIDLHRDGVGNNTRLVTEQNGVPMAQIMFFNGLSRTTKTGDIEYLYNPYIADNLAISFQMQLKAAEYYPGFTRRIYLKGYRYNMHYCPKTLLIEVGAQTNTLAEAKNAMVPLADLLNKVLTGQQ